MPDPETLITALPIAPMIEKPAARDPDADGVPAEVVYVACDVVPKALVYEMINVAPPTALPAFTL